MMARVRLFNFCINNNQAKETTISFLNIPTLLETLILNVFMVSWENFKQNYKYFQYFFQSTILGWQCMHQGFRIYSSLLNNRKGWNKYAGWSFFEIWYKSIWLIKVQIRACRMDLIQKKNKVCCMIFREIRVFFLKFYSCMALESISWAV